MNDTIAAISTPLGVGAISMIRLSGPDSWKIVKNLTGLENVKPRRVYRSVFKDETGPIDDVMVTFYRAPKSYTGEDMVEITCHGGYIVTNMILKSILRSGARLAEPGEFTKRAFLNGKMDLTEAEAINDLINAKSEIEVRNFFRNLKGDLKNFVEDIREDILETLAKIQVELDYPEEFNIDRFELEMDMKKLIEKLESALEDSERVVEIVHGVRVSIVGKPNVGKSTILNLLLKEDRAIVTPHPGTTRDIVTGDINIKGYHFRLSDTAGLRDSIDPVEKIGIEKAIEEIERSDLVIFVLDASDVSREDEEIFKKVESKKHVVVVNKMDLVEDFKPPEWISEFVKMSAIRGEGLEDLENALVDSVRDDFEILENKLIISNERQRRFLQNALENLKNALKSIAAGFPSDLIGVDLERALHMLDSITGRNFREDLIETIFSNFCVGK